MPFVDGLPDCLRIPTLPAACYVLKDSGALYLIDAGFFGGLHLLKRGLEQAGWHRLPIAGILVTHGHADHIWNVGRLARETGAWIAASPLDGARFLGKPHVTYKPGRDLARGEAALFGCPSFVPFRPDRELADGQRLDLWGGLRVVHLPGHTAGHVGFFSERHDVIFCADLFASFGHGLSHLPPALFNETSHEEILHGSVAKALRIPARGLLPHHSDAAAPEVHLERLRELARRGGLSLQR